MLQQTLDITNYSMFGLSASAKRVVDIRSSSQLKACLHLLNQNKIPYMFIGNGSNVVFSKPYFNGVLLVNKINKWALHDNCLIADSGTSLMQLSRHVSRKGYLGLECFGGIPATIGGAVFMNAGAFGRQMSDVVTGIDVMDENGNEFYLSASSIFWGYRQTSLQTKSLIVTRVYLNLKQGDDVWNSYNEYMKKKYYSQPWDVNSCGCFFKNPSSEKPSGMLIEKAGLKGKLIHGIRISSKHANFLINESCRSYEELVCAVNEICTVVKETSDVMLNSEVFCLEQQTSFGYQKSIPVRSY
jgi:UDP-N-acetylmuramate dehydrogenase